MVVAILAPVFNPGLHVGQLIWICTSRDGDVPLSSAARKEQGAGKLGAVLAQSCLGSLNNYEIVPCWGCPPYKIT